MINWWILGESRVVQRMCLEMLLRKFSLKKWSLKSNRNSNRNWLQSLLEINEREKTGQQNTYTGWQEPTKNWRFNYWTKLLDRYSLKIELKFSADLRFAVFFKFTNPINLLQKSVIRKPIYPHLLDELLKLLKRCARNILVGFSFWIVLGMQGLLLIFESLNGCRLVKFSIMFTHKRKRHQNSLVDSIPSKSSSPRSVAFLVS